MIHLNLGKSLTQGYSALDTNGYPNIAAVDSPILSQRMK